MKRKRDDLTDRFCDDLVIEAAKRGDVPLARGLFESGLHNPNPNATDVNGATALEYACECDDDGTEEVAELLIKHGANVNSRYRDDDGILTPLIILACTRDNTGFAKLLLENGANVNAEADCYRRTALHVTCYEGRLEFIQLLLEYGADLNAQDRNGDRPIYWALSKFPQDETNHQTHVVRLLIENGADIHVKGIFGMTPLHRACQFVSSSRAEFHHIKFLIDNGADVNAEDKDGYTPLLNLLLSADSEFEVIKLLVENGADLRAAAYGWTPLHFACENGKLGVVQFLVNRGASVNAKTRKGYTPLQVASEWNYPEVVWFFVRQYPWLVLEQSK